MARVRAEMEDAYVQQCRDHNDDDQADGPRRYVTRVAMPRCPIMNSTDKLSDR